jgi:hypothetical protein
MSKTPRIQTVSAADTFGEALTYGLQNFVKTSYLTPVTSSPGVGQFLSSVQGRASIPDITSDLKASFGVERIMTQSIIQLQDEFGANGEIAYGVLNDTNNQVRLVGTWNSIPAAAYGQYIQNQSTSDTVSYVEIVFYGTGLNLLSINGSSGNPMMSIDGGTETSLLGISGGSSVLGGRNYSGNIIIPVTNGLALGLHTIKIRAATCQFLVHGFEVLNAMSASANLNVNRGVAYVSGQKYINTYADSVDYNKDSSGNGILTNGKGGRIVRYLSASDTLGYAATACATSPSYLTNASHSAEEVARTFHLREFGAGRADDFSLLIASRAAYFTLDDGLTTLSSDLCVVQNTNSRDCLIPTGANNFITLTFIGTGLDVITTSASSNVDGFNIYVDGGSSAGTILGTSSTVQQKKIVSGLPYGTHTVKFQRNQSTGNATGICSFIVYQPKKPTLPTTGCVELCDYNVMANFVGNLTGGTNTISTGTLRRLVCREFIYVGTWAITNDSGVVGGIFTYTATTSSYLEYTFFGTGFDFRMSTPTTSSTYTMTIDGTNPTGAGATGTSYYNGITSFNAGTGLITTTAGTVYGSGVNVTGLPLGRHTMRVTWTSGSNLQCDALDVITPLHSYKSNLYGDLQNTLPVGNNSLMDTRKTSMIKEAYQKAWAQAIGINNSVSTSSSSPVPLADMSITVKTTGGPLAINFCGTFYNNAATGGTKTFIYVDGVAVGPFSMTDNPNVASAFIWMAQSNNVIVQVMAGVHKVDIYWSIITTGTSSSYDVNRILTVREL